MSGHLLNTVNPEAAAEDHDVPEAGTFVVYHARPGSGRGGHTKFPAAVMLSDRRKGTCSLYVLFGREDWREIDHVQRRTEQNAYGWDYTEETEGMLREIDSLREENEKLGRALQAQQAAIFGDFVEPKKADGSPKSIIDFLVEFEQRVFAAERVKK